jgi:hypothetical protein
MRKAFSLDEHFKQAEHWDLTFDDGILIIDNFYENPEEINEALRNRPYPYWKYNSERDSPNGVDYNDCRVVDKVGHPTRRYDNDMQRILNCCRNHWWRHEYTWNALYEVNCFQTINIFDNKLQHYPHIDSPLGTPDEMSTLNLIIYLDTIENGGTAIYEGAWLENREHQSLLYPVEDDMDLQQLIPHKFNRGIIVPGNRLHGAYIDDYTKYSGDNWRFSQVLFFHPSKGRNGGAR